MIYIIGDTHWRTGDEKKMFELDAKADDTVIVCGDFGVCWGDDSEHILDLLAKEPYTIAFVDGNHENFDMINSFPTKEWNGGKVHELRPNIFHLIRGEVFTIEGKKIWAFGGGYSFDKHLRIEHLSWWKEEMPTIDEMNYGMDNYIANEPIDIVITHTGPEDCVNAFLGRDKNIDPETSLNRFLQFVKNRNTYGKWYFGHLHLDRQKDNVYCLYNKIKTES